jgi:hypothetical protein
MVVEFNFDIVLDKVNETMLQKKVNELSATLNKLDEIYLNCYTLIGLIRNTSSREKGCVSVDYKPIYVQNNITTLTIDHKNPDKPRFKTYSHLVSKICNISQLFQLNELHILFRYTPGSNITLMIMCPTIESSDSFTNGNYKRSKNS